MTAPQDKALLLAEQIVRKLTRTEHTDPFIYTEEREFVAAEIREYGDMCVIEQTKEMIKENAGHDDDVRDNALEEAARIVDDHLSGKTLCAEGVAERIRSLKANP